MSTGPVFLPDGHTFSPEDLVFYADPSARSLAQALAEADVLVSCPHSGAAIPGELREYLAPEFTQRLQYDFTDCATSAIVRRWAELDPTIVYVENPHPRMVRDPNRARPDDLAATLTEALHRVREAGPFARVDLTGVDAIRPVTFSFFPLLRVPDSEAGVAELVAAFVDAGSRGVDVYQATRVDLLEQMTELTLTGASRSTHLTTLSFHDTMNCTTQRDGAVCVERDPKDRLPAVVALSNRGDHQGDPRPGNTVTMDPARLRLLAEAHRSGFEVTDPSDVSLNQPYLGSEEIITAGRRFAELDDRAAQAGATLDAVQAEFLRELLLGAANAAHIASPGTDWPAPDPRHVDLIARRCRDSWARYREARD
jgi:hypothetical protein